ncbi:hypothetical protein ACJJTC_016238 [Scirpophaga incertulas]
MVNCGACGKFLAMNGAATCATCGVKFHRACLALPDKAKLNKDWECPNCKKATRRGDNSQTPVRGIYDSDDGGDMKSSAEDCASIAGSAAQSGAVDQLSLSEMKVLRNEILECVKGMREFRSEMELLRASFASVCVRMDGIEQRLQALEQRSPDLSDDRVALLEQTISGLKLELNDRDQEALLTDLEIGQMPEDKAENAFHSVCVLATRLGVPLEERDVVYAEPRGRAGRTRQAGGLAAWWCGWRAEVCVMNCCEQRVCAGQGWQPKPGPRIYINERLTRFNRQLFHRGEGRQVFQLRSEMDIPRVFWV